MPKHVQRTITVTIVETWTLTLDSPDGPGADAPVDDLFTGCYTDNAALNCFHRPRTCITRTISVSFSVSRSSATTVLP
jgi:hypothetical protein